MCENAITIKQKLHFEESMHGGKKHPNSEVGYAFHTRIHYFYVAELNMKVWVFSLWRVAEGATPQCNRAFIPCTAIIHLNLSYACKKQLEISTQITRK